MSGKCQMRIGLFPGSFNPFHAGHLSVIKMALKHDFDFIYVVIGQNPIKPTNDFELNYQYITSVMQQQHLTTQVKVLIETGNIPQLANTLNIHQIIRGYRNQTDLDYEQTIKALYLNHNPNLSFKFYQAPLRYRKFNSSNFN